MLYTRLCARSWTEMEKMVPALKTPSPSSMTMNQVNRSTLR